MGNRLLVRAPGGAAPPAPPAPLPARLRQVTDDDLDAVGVACRRAWLGTSEETSLEDAVADIRAARAGTYGTWLPEACLLAEDDEGAVVGAVLTVTDPPWPDVPRGPFVIDLFVVPERRREGLGRALVQTALAAVDGSVGLRVDDDAWAALALYLDLGFRPPHGAPARGGGVPAGCTALRPTWSQLPEHVRAAVETRAGAAVVDAVSQNGGFTGGFASRVVLADGQRLFLKAADGDTAAWMRASYLREAAVVRALPDAVPATRVLWQVTSGAWVAVAFEDVEARHPRRPWVPEDLDRVLDALTRTAEALRPPPPGLTLEPLATQTQHFTLWERVVSGDDGARAAVPERWLPRAAELAALEADLLVLADGDAACHFDVRDDNLLLTPDGRVLVCDWNWLTRGAAWIDLVGLLVSVHGDGLDADAIVASHPLTRDVAPRAIDAFLAALAGYFIGAAASPQVAHSPWLRLHQAWWRDATLGWLEERLARHAGRSGS